MTALQEVLQRNVFINVFQAHKKANERNMLLSQQIDSLKNHSSSLRRELETTMERENAERREREQVNTKIAA